MKRLNFLGGAYIDVEEPYCRGCEMERHPELLPETVQPIFEDAVFTIRQDCEYACPGFYVVSVHEHISSMDALTSEQLVELFSLVSAVRSGIRECLGISVAHVYMEEKIDKSTHLHVWILPVWEEYYTENPRVYNGNIKEYMDSFNYDEEKDKILIYNSIMKDYIKAHYKP